MALGHVESRLGSIGRLWAIPKQIHDNLTNADFEYVFLHGPATNNKGGRPPKHSASALPIPPSISKSSYCAHFSAVKDVDVLLYYPPLPTPTRVTRPGWRVNEDPCEEVVQIISSHLDPTYAQKHYFRDVRFASASFAPGNLKDLQANPPIVRGRLSHAYRWEHRDFAHPLHCVEEFSCVRGWISCSLAAGDARKAGGEIRHSKSFVTNVRCWILFVKRLIWISEIDRWTAKRIGVFPRMCLNKKKVGIRFLFEHYHMNFNFQLL